MKAFLIAGLVASTFLSPAAFAAEKTGATDISTAVATSGSANFQRGDRRRGGERAAGQETAGQSGNDRQGNANRGDRRADRGGGQNAWRQPVQQPQPQMPVNRRADGSSSQSQPQPQWRDNRREQGRGDRDDNRWQRNDGQRNGAGRDDTITSSRVQRDNRELQSADTQNQSRDDRYGNGFDRERGTWDRNDRGYDDRYGNGFDRNEGRWNDRNDRNDRDNVRRDDYRDNRDRNDRNDRYDNRRDEQRWNNSWRNDRRYDWRGHRSQYRDHYRRPSRYYAPVRNHRYSRFSIGLYIGSGFYHQNYWLNDPWEYRLPPVHGPYRWVRYYDDVLLIDVRNGYVVDVINDFFW